MSENSEPTDFSFDEVQQGLVYSRVFVDKNDKNVKYHLIEPYADPDLFAIIEDIKKKVIEKATFERIATDNREKDFESLFSGIVDHYGLDFTPAEKSVVKYYVKRDVVEFGRIQGLMLDQNIEDISCDAPKVPVYAYHRAYGFIPTNILFESEDDLNTYVKRIVQDSGKHISISVPIIDATLPDGSRLQASFGRYITNNGPAFTIRKFRSSPLSPVSLVMGGSISAKIMSYLWVLTEYGANMMVAGGTGSGKTTLLNAILLFIPPQMKVVSIEDTREINIPHENWIPTVTRSGFGALNKGTGKRAGEIDMFDLLAASLRQRPNYIIIGEVRGKEAFTVFQAMSAGRYG
ncbi:MAG: type II/IV secretion system ATPase subunit, partial [Candidatus Thermoplasmatota archaeon]|nr:type II/IV secretion system ATPase subunit [Candidatus Thermoplasmatota archaeon]